MNNKTYFFIVKILLYVFMITLFYMLTNISFIYNLFVSFIITFSFK